MNTLRKQSEAMARLREQLAKSVHATHPAKEDEYHYEEEAVAGTQSWDDGWFEEEEE